MSQGGYPDRSAPSGPKPYDFVPFPRSVMRRPMSHGQETVLGGEGYYTGVLTLEMQALTSIFVAAGRYALSEDLAFPPGEAMRGCYRIAGRPAIPAASLKGVVRSVAEAVSPSHVTLTRLDISHDLKDTGACRARERSCPACALFGTGGTKAHIGLARFEDMLPAPGTRTGAMRLMPLYAPRASGRQVPQVYQDESGELAGRKFYSHSRPAEDPDGDACEVIPARTRFTTRLSFLNLDAPLLGVLFFALSLDGSFKLKLGGGKPLGLGSLEVTATELMLRSRVSLFSANGNERKTGDALATFVTETMQAAQNERLLLGPQVKKLREILKWPPQREGVRGPY